MRVLTLYLMSPTTLIAHPAAAITFGLSTTPGSRSVQNLYTLAPTPQDEVKLSDGLRLPAACIHRPDRLEFFGAEQRDVYDTLQTLLGGVSVGYSK